jgi:hypothetical protein
VQLPKSQPASPEPAPASTPTPIPALLPTPAPTLAPSPVSVQTPKKEAYEKQIPLSYEVNSCGTATFFKEESRRGKSSPDLFYQYANVTNTDREGGIFTVIFLDTFGDISQRQTSSEYIAPGETKRIQSEGYNRSSSYTSFSVNPPTKTVIAYRDITPEQTSTSQQSTLTEGNFLITIISPRQATITNNYQRSVEVYQFSMKYDCYSYIIYNAPGGGTSYGPIVKDVLTSDEHVILKTGQSYPKTFNRKDIVNIVSCSFNVKDLSTGQTLTITYP